MRRLTLAATGLVLVLGGCSAGSATDATTAEQVDPARPEAEAMLAAHDLDGLAPEQIIDELDRLAVADRPADLMASVRVEELVLADDAGEVALDLPEDRFYLSVAPFVDQTHECFYHSLTTCTGELGGEEIEVRIVDDGGEVLVDEQATTFDNGFAGFWLPRDVEGRITVTHDGRSGAVDFSTGADDPTCVTTLQLV